MVIQKFPCDRSHFLPTSIMLLLLTLVRPVVNFCPDIPSTSHLDFLFGNILSYFAKLTGSEHLYFGKDDLSANFTLMWCGNMLPSESSLVSFPSYQSPEAVVAGL